MNSQETLLETRNLTVGYKQRSRQQSKIISSLDLKINAGQLICLIGPNGSGKSTLIRTLSGLQKPLEGKVLLGNDDIEKIRIAEIAKKLSVVLTEKIIPGNLDVLSLVALGRFPYTGWLGTETKEDKRKINFAIEAAQIESLCGRRVNELSDGECQRIMLARAIAQDTKLIILDEPTAHLDLPNRIELMRLCHHFSRNLNKGILISTHELDLALQVADQIWLLDKNGNMQHGSPEDLVLNGTFEKAFNTNGTHFDKETGAFNIYSSGGFPVVLRGEGAPSFWTKRALLRIGCKVLSDNPDLLQVYVHEKSGKTTWQVSSSFEKINLSSIHELVSYLKNHIDKYSNSNSIKTLTEQIPH